MPRFCRHNRLLAECPICSRDTVLDSGRPAARRAARPRPEGAGPAAPPTVTGPYGAVGPYEDETGARYEVRLERVPGALRLAEWARGKLRRRAPVVPAADVGTLIARAVERAELEGGDAAALVEALRAPPGEGDRTAVGRSPGRAGELEDELRVEAAAEGTVRIARWVWRPGAGFELQRAPVLLPAARFAEALGHAARLGLLEAASETGATPRP